MRITFLIVAVSIVVSTLMGSAYAQDMAALAGGSTSVNSPCPAYYSRPDLRLCFGYPQCGGDWLYEPPRKGEDTCLDELTLVQYVSGIYVREDDGTLTRIHPSCYQPLTGSIETDPVYPEYDIFVYLACVD